MKNAGLIVFVLMLFAVSAIAAGGFPLKAVRIAPNATKISNVADVGYAAVSAYFTPDGKYLIVTANGEFAALPTANLDEQIANLDKARAWKGTPSSSLPSGKIVFSTPRGIYALDTATEKVQTIYALPESEFETERDYLDWNMVVMSENLIIAGDGDSGDGTPAGNILRFDVRRGRRTRGAPIAGFFNPRLSPSRKFILFEHGNGLTTEFADIYDVRRGVNFHLMKRFNVKRAFPKYANIKVRPLDWVGADTFLAEVEKIESDREISDATYLGENSWIVLLNAATGKIVWKIQPKITFGATRYESLSAAEVLVDTTEGVYVLSLADGKLKRLARFNGQQFVPSPDKKQVAYFENFDELYVSALSGAEKKKILDLPKEWEVKRWTLRPPLWSPDGKRLIVFDEKEFLFVRL